MPIHIVEIRGTYLYGGAFKFSHNLSRTFTYFVTNIFTDRKGGFRSNQSSNYAPETRLHVVSAATGCPLLGESEITQFQAHRVAVIQQHIVQFQVPAVKALCHECRTAVAAGQGIYTRSKNS